MASASSKMTIQVYSQYRSTPLQVLGVSTQSSPGPRAASPQKKGSSPVESPQNSRYETRRFSFGDMTTQKPTKTAFLWGTSRNMFALEKFTPQFFGCI